MAGTQTQPYRRWCVSMYKLPSLHEMRLLKLLCSEVGSCLCERVFERTQSNWIRYTVMLLRHLTIDMVRFLPLMDPIYALSTHKCAHIECSFFHALRSICLTHGNTKPISLCRLVCDSPKPSVDAAVATTELVFSLAIISTYLSIMHVLSQPVFSIFFQCQRFANFFSLLSSHSHARHHITSHNIVCLQFSRCHFSFTSFSLPVNFDACVCACVWGFFLFIVIIIFDQQLLGIRFSLKLFKWWHSTAIFSKFVCVRYFVSLFLFFHFQEASKKEHLYEIPPHHYSIIKLVVIAVTNGKAFKPKQDFSLTHSFYSPYLLKKKKTKLEKDRELRSDDRNERSFGEFFFLSSFFFGFWTVLMCNAFESIDAVV